MCSPHALAITIAKAVQKGMSAEDIKRRVVERVGAHRLPLAHRCEAASRYLWTLKDND